MCNLEQMAAVVFLLLGLLPSGAGCSCSLLCVLADMWVEGNPLQPQSLVPLLRRLALEPPPALRELGLDADQA